MDREDGQHGGVAILHKPNIHCSPLAIKNTSDFICAAEVSIGDRNLLIVCVYIPPRSSLYRPSWKKVTKTLLSVVAIFTGDIIITGDFNEPTTDWASFDSRHSDMDCFFDFLIERNFQQLISSPTHIAGNVLDLAFTNSDSISLSLPANIKLSFSDHYALPMEIKLSNCATETTSPSIHLSRANYSLLNDTLISSTFSVEMPI